MLAANVGSIMLFHWGSEHALLSVAAGVCQRQLSCTYDQSLHYHLPQALKSGGRRRAALSLTHAITKQMGTFNSYHMLRIWGWFTCTSAYRVVSVALPWHGALATQLGIAPSSFEGELSQSYEHRASFLTDYIACHHMRDEK